MRIPDLRRAVLLVATAVVLLGASTASADSFGEITSWGSPGTGAGQFSAPQGVAVDPTDHSVYALDIAADGSFRLQKFADPGSGPAGAATATATIARAANGAGKLPFSAGLAIDPALHQIYVLEYRDALDAVTGVSAVERIDVFSTQDSGGALPSVGTLPLPDATDIAATDVIDTPGGFAVDPTTHDLLVLGYDRTGAIVIQRLSSAGAPVARYVDAAGSPFRLDVGSLYSSAVALAVAPDGTIYVGVGASTFPLYLFKLTPSFDTVTDIVASTDDPTDAANRETWKNFGAASAADRGIGAQMAVAPDDSAVYWTERFRPGSSTSTTRPGSYLVRGYSPATGATAVLFGGTNTNPATACQITTDGASLATDRDGVVYTFDRGNFDAAPATWGAKITKFGPGGSGCPVPVASFTAAGRSDPTVTVTKGDSVTFDASGSDFHGSTPSELDWDFDGSGTFATVVTGAPAETTIDHAFLQVGTFTVGLRMTVDGSSVGQPLIVTKRVTVVAGTPTAAFRASTSSPSAGATVTFDAGSSVDPTGSASGGPTRTLRTYRWDFGDGTTQTTSTATIGHAFANASSASIRRTVRLAVTSFDSVDSAPVTQTIAVQGTPSTGGPGPGGGGGTPDPGTSTTPVITTPPPAIAGPGNATLSAAKLSGSSAALTVGCAASPGACSGTITLVATLPARARRGHKAKATATTVGSVGFSLAAGARKTIAVKLSKAARGLLARSHRLKLTVRIETRNAAGAKASTSKTATLVLPARRKARGRR